MKDTANHGVDNRLGLQTCLWSSFTFTPGLFTSGCLPPLREVGKSEITRKKMLGEVGSHDLSTKVQQ